MSDLPAPTNRLELATEIISAYVSRNSVPAGELPALIQSVHATLATVGNGPIAKSEPEPQVPAISVKKSVTPDYIICLEDGKKFKSLKRHLKTSFDMTPGEYRAKWKLPEDYPMVAPNYAASRSALAKTMGLGQKARVAAVASAPVAPPAPVEVPEPARRGRARKAA